VFSVHIRRPNNNLAGRLTFHLLSFTHHFLKWLVSPRFVGQLFRLEDCFLYNAQSFQRAYLF